MFIDVHQYVMRGFENFENIEPLVKSGIVKQA